MISQTTLAVCADLSDSEVGVEQRFGTGDVVRCSDALRTVGDGATSMEEAASAVVDHLRAHFVSAETGDSALALVRCYVIEGGRELWQGPIEELGSRVIGSPTDPGALYLTLLAESGENTASSDLRPSLTPRMQPLPTAEALRSLPIIARLIEQIGVAAEDVLDPDQKLLRELTERAPSVFCIEEASGSPLLLGQDDPAIPQGIRSIVGFGGLLPKGPFIGVVLYSTVPILPSTLDAFTAVALSVKVALLPHVGGDILTGRQSASRAPAEQLALDLELSKACNLALAQLLDLRRRIFEREVTLAEDRARDLARSVAHDVEDSEDQARQLARTVARNVATSNDEARQLATSVARDVATSNDEARDLATSVALDVAHSISEARELAESVAQDVATSLDVARDLARSVARNVARYEDQARELATALAQAIARDIANYEEQAQALTTSREAFALSEARKQAILEGALDCVIGMDSQGCITDFNRAAETTFGYDRNEVVGKDLAEILIPPDMRERHRLGLAKLLTTGEGPILGQRIEVRASRRNGTTFPAELSVTRVEDTSPPFFSAYVRDITATKEAAEQLATSRQRLEHIARTLQDSLLPPVLPAIPGMELAAAFRALGDGYEVGGDFYDVFELTDRKWALTLGDVCGKGSEAAVVTALARYTLRAAAMHGGNPADVLCTLNEAIYHQYPDRFCTAVYATLDPATGTVELALGGHPHPLLLTAAGDMRVVGTTGPILGPFETWHGVTETVVLGPGDTLLLYSDGVNEARAGADFFGDDRLAATLSAAKGLHARAAVELIDTTVLNFAGELNDDLALLAIRRNDTQNSLG